MDSFLPELSSSCASDPLADADVNLHDLQHMALFSCRFRRNGRLLPFRMEEICRS